LPWYTDYERIIYTERAKKENDLNGLLFPDLLHFFLDEGRKVYGDVWDKGILYSGDKYKERSISSYDQVLITILAAQPKLRINMDLRRLDKFGSYDGESVYASTIFEKSVEDSTYAHLDGITNTNWWRLESIWLIVFKDKSPSLLSEAIEFFFKTCDRSMMKLGRSLMR